MTLSRGMRGGSTADQSLPLVMQGQGKRRQSALNAAGGDKTSEMDRLEEAMGNLEESEFVRKLVNILKAPPDVTVWPSGSCARPPER